MVVQESAKFVQNMICLSRRNLTWLNVLWTREAIQLTHESCMQTDKRSMLPTQNLPFTGNFEFNIILKCSFKNGLLKGYLFRERQASISKPVILNLELENSINIWNFERSVIYSLQNHCGA